jgi:hypothetical protein
MPRYTRLVHSKKLRLLGAVVALAATAPFSAAHAVNPIRCRNGAPTIKGPGIWQEFRSPKFSPALGLTVSQDITAYAVDPTNPDKIAATNGNSIYVSTDGGCEWAFGLRLDQAPADPTTMPLSGEFTRIVSLYIAPRSHRVFAMAEELDNGATVGRPHVLESVNGTTWTLGDSGLPPLGHPLVMHGSLTNPNVVYLSFANAREQDPGATCPPPPVPCPGGDGTGRQLGLLWGSADGGKTWSSRTDPSDLNGSYPIKFFSVEDDDATGNTIWAVANGALLKSTNGGRSYTKPDGLDQSNFAFSAVESINKGDPRNHVRLVAFSAQGEMIRLEDNKWIRSRVPFGPVESVAQRPEGDIAVATTPQAGQVSIYRIYPHDFRDFAEGTGIAGKQLVRTYGWEAITPGTSLTQAANLSWGAGGSAAAAGTFYIRDRRRVLRFLYSARRLPPHLVTPVDVGAPPPPQGHLLPGVLNVNLPLGRSQTVDYRLTLPPAPTPIDVFLLIDNSGSMEPLIDDLKKNMGVVARSLVASGIDVNMGVGQINVQPDSPPVDDPTTTDVDEGKQKPLYQLLRRIGPVNGDFYRALAQLDGNGGSGQEAQLESLWQSVTGDGLSLVGIPALTGYTIPPHQQAGFRSGVSSIKVIVHATDEEFSTHIGEIGYQGHSAGNHSGAHNTPGPVGDALRNNGVKQIGLSQDVIEAHDDLADMARRTGAVAPAGGTDCNGDGRADIKPGGALVCDQNTGLDKTIVNLLKSLADPQTISLSTHGGPTMRNVTRASFAIDAKQATNVSFAVTYSCVGVQAGSYDNTIEAALRGISIAKAVATVNCGAFPPPPARADVFEGNPPVAPQPPAPAPAPIAPVNPLPQAQSQPQAQVNPQAGVANQEQDQLQVATADNDITEGEADELAFSRLDQRSSWLGGGLVLGTGMALTSALAGGVALRRRTRTRVARATLH